MHQLCCCGLLVEEIEVNVLASGEAEQTSRGGELDKWKVNIPVVIGLQM